MRLDEEIAGIQGRHWRRFASVSIVLATILVVLVVWLFLISGFRLVVGPPDAAQNFQVQPVAGFAWPINDRLYVLGSEATIEVSSPTFESTQVRISTTTPDTVPITLAPQPAILRSEIQAEMDTSWYIDDEIVHVGNQLVHELEHGPHKLRVENPHYKSWQSELTLARGQEKVISPKLDRVQGELILGSKPPGARVSIDGQARGTTPYAGNFPGGRYAVRVELDGYQAAEEAIDVTERQPLQRRSYRLLPQQAELELVARPQGGALLLDNLAVAPGRHPVDANRPHRVSYRKAGYFPFDEQITLKPGERITLPIALKAEVGAVYIDSEPRAQVLIDGQLLGETPFNTELSAVAHRLELRRDGYRTLTRTVQPSATAAVRLDVRLVTEFQARRDEGKPLFAESLGIQMKGFRGGRVTLGSPENLPGRRRNEHRVKVKLQRPFWVAVHEITEEQFAAFRGSGPSSNLPVVDVTWREAAEYCNWLSQQEGLPQFYRFRDGRLSIDPQSTGYRLPTEAEWEWLAKKARRSKATTYVWGNTQLIPRGAGNFADSSMQGKQLIFFDDYEDKHSARAPVGSYGADRAGLFDMAGNVSEWVHDAYSDRVPELAPIHTDYLGAGRGGRHVVKGGNYTSGRLRELRAAYREPSGTASATVGFRIARYDR